jgi:hypothetical protein
MGTRRVESFLLRIVVPDGQPVQPQQWRGRIQHVASGAEQQIDELGEVIAFINTHLASLDNAEFRFEPTPVDQ